MTMPDSGASERAERHPRPWTADRVGNLFDADGTHIADAAYMLVAKIILQAVNGEDALKAEVARLREAVQSAKDEAILLVAKDLSALTGLTWDPIENFGLRQVVAAIQAEAETRGRSAMRGEIVDILLRYAVNLGGNGPIKPLVLDEKNGQRDAVRQGYITAIRALPDRSAERSEHRREP